MRYSADAPFPSLSWSVFSGEPHCLCFSSFFVSSAFFSLSPITWRTFVAKYVSMQRLYRRLYHKRTFFFFKSYFRRPRKYRQLFSEPTYWPNFGRSFSCLFFPDSMFFFIVFPCRIACLLLSSSENRNNAVFFLFNLLRAWSSCWDLGLDLETLLLRTWSSWWQLDQVP